MRIAICDDEKSYIEKIKKDNNVLANNFTIQDIDFLLKEKIAVLDKNSDADFLFNKINSDFMFSNPIFAIEDLQYYEKNYPYIIEKFLSFKNKNGKYIQIALLLNQWFLKQMSKNKVKIEQFVGFIFIDSTFYIFPHFHKGKFHFFQPFF